jgi:hypothetical protein
MKFNKEDWEDLAKTLGYKSERELLEDLYVTRGESIFQISNSLGVGPTTISHRLDLYEIPKRQRGGDNNPGRQTGKLFRLDQRCALRINLDTLSQITGISRSLLYKYRKARMKNGTLHTESDTGS